MQGRPAPAGRAIQPAGEGRRADGIIAYNLAAVVDDHASGITHIMRGVDLLDTTFNQLHLYALLRRDAPIYAHHPLMIDPAGKKYSKQQGAVDILTLARPAALIFHGLILLGQQPPTKLARAGVAELLAWAITNWRLENIPRARRLEAVNPLPTYWL